MSLIIAARFPTFDAANAAAGRLIASGVPEEAIHVFYVNPPGAHDRYPAGGDVAEDPGAKGTPGKALGVAAVLGAVGAVVGGVIVSMFADSLIPMLAGAGVGAYVGSLAGAMSGMDRRRKNVQDPRPPREAGEGRPAGVMLAVNVDGERADEIARMLVAAGGREVERARGRWRGGKWEDFDPLAPAVPQTAEPGSRDLAP
jgi:hypothetical protein